MLNGASKIAYQYTLPNNYTKENVNEIYKWDLDSNDWSACNKSCGKGFKSKVFNCIDSEKRVVNNTFCDLLVKPNDIIEPCNSEVSCNSE